MVPQGSKEYILLHLNLIHQMQRLVARADPVLPGDVEVSHAFNLHEESVELHELGLFLHQTHALGLLQELGERPDAKATHIPVKRKFGGVVVVSQDEYHAGKVLQAVPVSPAPYQGRSRLIEAVLPECLDEVGAQDQDLLLRTGYLEHLHLKKILRLLD